MNRKNQRNGITPTCCVLVECDPARLYSIDEFSRFEQIDFGTENNQTRSKKSAISKRPNQAGMQTSPGNIRRKNSYQKLLERIKTGSSNDRSKSDFALIAVAIEEGIPKEKVWEDVEDESKFKERGRDYFDRTWSKAEMKTSHKGAIQDYDDLETIKAPESHAGADSLAPNPSVTEPRIVIPKKHEKIHLEANTDCLDSVVKISCLLYKCENLYQQSGSLFFETEVEGIKQLAPMTAPVLSTYVTSIVQFYSPSEKGDQNLQPPSSIINSVISHRNFPKVPVVEQVTNGPTMTRDGKLLLHPGYNEDSRTYGAFKPLPEDFVVPEFPSKGDAIAAVHRLMGLVVDFPFKCPADLSAWLAFIFTIVLRPAIDRAPIIMFIANRAGTGKSMLSNMAVLISTGRAVSPVDYSTDNDKMEKLLTTLLLESKAVCDFDNVPNGAIFGTSTIDRLVTAENWTGRLLGSSKSISVANKITVVASGNNLSTASDTSRRVIVCRLHTDHIAPADRSDFEVADLLEYLMKNHQRFLLDVLIILQVHFQAGCPGDYGAMGSFKGWSRRVDSLFSFLGLESPLESTKFVRGEMNIHDNEAASLLETLFSIYSDRCFTSSNLVEYLDSPSYQPRQKDSIAVLMEIFSVRDSKDPKQIGNKLRSLKNQWFRCGEFERSIVHDGKSGGVARWKVVTKEISLDISQSDDASMGQGGQGGQGGQPTTPYNVREYIDSWYNRMRSAIV